MKNIGKALAPIHRSLYFPPAVIFAVIFVATIFGWQAAKATLHQDIRVAAASRADTAQQALREHMVTYEQILNGGAGLFRSSSEVTHGEWKSFLNAFNINTNLSGVQVIGFSKVFDANTLPQVSNFMQTQGVPDFHITPAEPVRGQYAAVLYVYDVGTQNVVNFGADQYADANGRDTMYRARDTAEMSMTPPFALADGKTYGFTIFTPYFMRSMPTDTPAERQAALGGYVFAAFNADSFFKNIVSSADGQTMGFMVQASDNGKKRTVYTSPTYNTVSALPLVARTERNMSLYGQTWTITFVGDSRSLVSAEQLNQPDSLLFVGTLSAFLVSAVVLLLIKARTRDLSTQKEKAVELAKDELLSLASHQLRTPATGVKQYVGMVLQGFAGKVPPTQKKLLEKAYASNDRQLRIINEILHLAKIDAGRIVLAKQPTNLDELVSDVVNEQRPDVEAAEHQLRVELPPDPITISADTHMLRMALENLVSNAIKYTPAGGRITVRVFKDDDYAFTSVSDTGVGIKPEDKDKIFRQFSRLANEMSQQVGGTGIGLYLAKHLVELHKGFIAFESEPGKGSTFTIAMPLRPGKRKV